MKSQAIMISIVDDHTMFREGLVNLLREHEQIKVLFEARNGLAMQEELINHSAPDVILMDINMPRMDGHEATGWLRQHYPNIYVLALSMYEDDESIIKMIRKGARGYILKESNVQELVRAIVTVCETGYYINELVTGRLMRTLQEVPNGEDGKVAGTLTARETEFMQLCCTEFTYKEIAEQMQVSPRTIDGYRDSVFEKLQVKSRTGIVLYAIKHSLVEII